jgi:hypothetical protein
MGATAFAAILSGFLPILLANVPFNRAATVLAHNICTWAAVAVLSYMLAITGVLLATVFRPGLYEALPFEPSALEGMVVPAILASGSSELLGMPRGTSVTCEAEQEKRLAGARYGLLLGYEGDSTLRCEIEVVKKEREFA